MTTKKAAPKSSAPVFIREPRYYPFEMNRGNGVEPLRAEIRYNMSYAELEAIPKGRVGVDVTIPEIFAGIAPYIRSWSVTAIDQNTGKPAPLPPPMEAGPDVMHFLEMPEIVWIVDKVRNGWAIVQFAQREDDASTDADEASAA